MSELLTVGELQDLRHVAESGMVDACVVFDPKTAVRELDPDSLAYTETTPPTAVYDGKCRVRSQEPPQGMVSAGDRDWAVQWSVVKLPMATSTGVRVGQMCRITASRDDPTLAGRLFRVMSVAHLTHGSSRRLLCKEMAG